MTAEVAALGVRLRERGLGARALLHCLGLRFPLPGRRPETARSAELLTPPVAAVPALLFAGGERIAADAVHRCLGDDVELLEALGLIEIDAGAVRAPVALLPVGSGIAVCPWDRLPDDSSLHLTGALPAAPVPRWLDVGTGAGFAPLARPELAPAIVATDIDPELIELGELALALSGHHHVAIAEADLCAAGAGSPGWSLITFNAPLAPDLPALLDRFWAQAARLVAPDGEVIVHSRLPVPAALASLGGALAICRYDQFAITAWRPGGDAAPIQREAALDEQAPHVQRDWIWAADPR